MHQLILYVASPLLVKTPLIAFSTINEFSMISTISNYHLYFYKTQFFWDLPCVSSPSNLCLLLFSSTFILPCGSSPYHLFFYLCSKPILNVTHSFFSYCCCWYNYAAFPPCSYRCGYLHTQGDVLLLNSFSSPLRS